MEGKHSAYFIIGNPTGKYFIKREVSEDLIDKDLDFAVLSLNSSTYSYDVRHPKPKLLPHRFYPILFNHF